jgi:hypothetical protein
MIVLSVNNAISKRSTGITMCNSQFNFINVINSNTPLSWNQFIFAADVDYINLFITYHLGVLPVGTLTWLFQHTIEKYLKAVLNQYDNVTYSENFLRNNRFGHNIQNLWQEQKNITNQILEHTEYNSLIQELSQITVSTRYLEHTIVTRLGLIETFSILCTDLRYFILGNSDFHSRFYGIEPGLMKPRAFLNGANYYTLFQKLMHFLIEHGISISPAGIPDTFSNNHLQNLSVITQNFRQAGNYPELEYECPVCNNQIWINGIRGHDDYIILNDYFSAL